MTRERISVSFALPPTMRGRECVSLRIPGSGWGPCGIIPASGHARAETLAGFSRR
jgi:hypothetical protein